ncbi:hypothetical protein ACGFNV_36300 [Streptomyces sp. NPDC048751]|uniref:hypothetical protein n=1 Tax=Streptomyces sp. NPDC048751 TaxID=3365591 RepID=UPI003719EC81
MDQVEGKRSVSATPAPPERPPSRAGPTDALVRVTASCVCGSDLWPYASAKPEDAPPGWATSSSASSRAPARM